MNGFPVSTQIELILSGQREIPDPKRPVSDPRFDFAKAVFSAALDNGLFDIDGHFNLSDLWCCLELFITYELGWRGRGSGPAPWVKI